MRTANPTAKSVRLIGAVAMGGFVLRDLASALQAKFAFMNIDTRRRKSVDLFSLPFSLGHFLASLVPNLPIKRGGGGNRTRE